MTDVIHPRECRKETVDCPLDEVGRVTQGHSARRHSRRVAPKGDPRLGGRAGGGGSATERKGSWRRWSRRREEWKLNFDRTRQREGARAACMPAAGSPVLISLPVSRLRNGTGGKEKKTRTKQEEEEEEEARRRRAGGDGDRKTSGG